MKIRPTGAEILHADGRTDRHKNLIAFSSFAKALKNSTFLYVLYGSKKITTPLHHKLIGFYNQDGVFTARYGLNPIIRINPLALEMDI